MKNIPLSDFYGVEIEEILVGESKSETMNGELKGTLLKVDGGCAYLFLIVKNGVWDSACNVKDNRATSFVISLVCGLAFSALLYVILRAQVDHPAIISGTFFAGMTVIGYAVIRALSALSKKNKK